MAEVLRWSDGVVARNRIQAFDGAWSTQTLTVPARKMAATFDDSKGKRYRTNANPGGSVKVAGVGVVARVVTQTAHTITVEVTNP